MTKRVLDVGQCGPDHAGILAVLNQNFDVEIDQAHSNVEAIALASERTYDLILINRILDADGTEGMEILRTLSANPATSAVPKMIVSNFDETQQEAVTWGAVPGFGKSALLSPATIELLAPYLRG